MLKIHASHKLSNFSLLSGKRLRSITDPVQAAASLLRFVDEAASRAVQPGQGRRGEHGVIASGRVIPTITEHEASSSSRLHMDTTLFDTRVVTSSPPTVKRVMRRKVRLFSPTGTMKSVGLGRENRPEAVKILLKEACFIRENPRAGCLLSPRRDNIFQWTAVLEGPPGTVYEGGTFFCNVHFTLDYPNVAPKVEFLTRIYHCNVNAQGKVSIDILNKKWEPSMSVSTVRSALMSLFYSCNPDEALVASISKEYQENRDEFNRMARIWTLRYAV